jgi:predicted GNAT family N-acyltransferase
MITKLYKINNSNKKELNRICELFTNTFVSEPQYQDIFKKQNTLTNVHFDNRLEISNSLKIKKLIKIQTEQLVQDKNNSIEIYSPNEKLNSIIILINTKDKNYAKTIFSNKNSLKQLKLIKKHFSIFQTLKILTYTIHTNNTLKKLINKSDYILYNIVVDKQAKGQGHATKLIKPILNKFDNEKLTVALNTNNASNIHIYEHFGFKLHKMKTEKKIKEYQMIRDPQINKIRMNKKY